MNIFSPRRGLLFPLLLLALLFLVRRADAAEYILGPVLITFAKGSVQLNQSGQAKIGELAAALRGKRVKKIQVEGFSDNTAVTAKNPFADNKSLAAARAEYTARALQEASGLSPRLFTYSGKGEAKELGPNNSENSQALNRRVEIRAIIDDQAEVEAAAAAPPPAAPPQEPPPAKEPERITLSLRKVDLAEVFEMLSKQQRVNIVLEKEVAGTVNVNLFAVTLDEAITTIASSAGYEAKKTGLGYLIKVREAAEPAKETAAATEIRMYPVQYAKPEKVETILAKHLSKNGKATALSDRSMVVIEDTPLILDRIEVLLKEVDREPRQILIEAKILEITLSDTESFGLNWWKIFTSNDKTLNLGATGSGRVGVRGLSTSETGFIFNLVNENFNITLDALNAKGRVKTLSTPKILTLENKESSVIIGDRKGYTVTTTIAQVTTTSVAFLESGVILKVTPSVDRQNRILLQIHPEVSSGSVTGGIPSQTTTEVSTALLADNGQTIFIGGLLKKKSSVSKDGVPILGDLPVLGRAFSNAKDIEENTETVVLITPYIINKENEQLLNKEIEKVDGVENR